jgi:hypothetical protein
LKEIDDFTGKVLPVDDPLFVGRDDEIELFEDFLKPASQLRILNFYTDGQGGVGKTTLLSHLQKRCDELHSDIFYNEDLIDFHLENRNETEVMAGIAKSIGLEEFKQVEEKFREAAKKDIAEREKLGVESQTRLFVEVYNKFAKNMSKEGKLIVLFFDTYEYAQQPSTTEEGKTEVTSTDFSNWLETELFVKLSNQENARLVIAGRCKPLKEKVFGASYKPILLKPFSPENTE